jgi:hypothetical protein
MPPSYDKLASASAIYAYAGNDPINGMDPTGHSSFSDDDGGWDEDGDNSECINNCGGGISEPDRDDRADNDRDNDGDSDGGNNSEDDQGGGSGDDGTKGVGGGNNVTNARASC